MSLIKSSSKKADSWRYLIYPQLSFIFPRGFLLLHLYDLFFYHVWLENLHPCQPLSRMTSIEDHLASYPNSWSQYHVTNWSSLFSTNVEELRIDIVEIMAVQKQSMPSFASIISVLSIVFYCAGFLRVELELHEQKKRINALESVAEAKSPSNDTDMKIIKNAPGKFFWLKLELTRQIKIKKQDYQNQASLFELHILSLN